MKTSKPAIDTDKKYVHIAVYGTLRLGGRLNPYYLSEAEHLMTTEISGFKMYHTFHIGFPVVFATGNSEDKVTVDVFKAPRAAALNIAAMEPSAVYKTKVVEIEGQNCIMWVGHTDKEYLTKTFDEPVPNGDWIMYTWIDFEPEEIKEAYGSFKDN